MFRLTREGAVTPWLIDVDGRALPPTNFVLLDAGGGNDGQVAVFRGLDVSVLGFEREHPTMLRWNS